MLDCLTYSRLCDGKFFCCFGNTAIFRYEIKNFIILQICLHKKLPCSKNFYIVFSHTLPYNALLQKKYTVDIFSKKEKKNEGELPQYYVEDGHPAIIPRVIFDYVQFFLNEKSKRWDNAFSCKFESYCIITCGSCKSQYGFRVSHSNNKYRSIFWRCNGCYTKNCDNPKIADVELLKFKEKAIENFIYDNQDRLKEIVKEFSYI